MTLEQLLALAHARYPELSIDSQIITHENRDDDRVLVGARITTPSGSYTAWGEGFRGDVSRVEEEAVLRALMRTNVLFSVSPEPALAIEIAPVEDADSEGTEGAETELVCDVAEIVTSYFQGITDDGARDAAEEADSGISCADCQGTVAPYYGGTVTLPAAEVAKRSLARHGRVLCADCSSAAVFKRSKK